jgi:hypothetical protein
LALLIDRQNDGVVWRTDIEPDDIAQLGDELRIIGQLELTDPMGLQAMGTPDALDRADANPDRFGHGRPRPMGRGRGRSSQGQPHHALGNVGTQGRDARGRCLVTPQPGEAFSAKPLLPAPDDGLGLSGSPLDLVGAMALGRQQNDLRPPDMATTASNSARSAAVSLNWVLSCIPQTRMIESAGGIRKRIEMSDLVH